MILTLWLYHTLWRASYREVLEIARQAGFSTPALSTYHYRVYQLSLELFQYLVIQIGKDLANKNSASWRFLLVNGTEFGFKEYFKLSLHRAETLRKVRSHVRLVILAMVDEMVDEKGRGLLLGAAVGPPYASEKQLFLDTLEDMDCLPSLPVVGDRAYDSVEVIERLKELGGKRSLQIGVKHPLRKESQKNWERWGKYRYRVEGFFGCIKQKVGSVFPLLREDLAMKRALAAAVLYNLSLLSFILCFFLALFISWFFSQNLLFLEQPLILLTNIKTDDRISQVLITRQSLKKPRSKGVEGKKFMNLLFTFYI